MSIIKWSKRTNNLKKEIESVLIYMRTLSPDSAEYTAAAKNLEILCNTQGKDKDRRISPDTIAVVAGNIVGIVIIVWYEQLNVISSKALSLIIKGRV